jgi:hypothetical protein
MEEQPENTIENNDEEQGSGETKDVQGALIFGINTDQDVSIKESAAFGVAAGRDMQVSESGAFGIAAGRDMSMTESGALSMNVGGNAEINEGGALLLRANQVTANNSTFGVLITDQANLEEGSQVNMMMDTQKALVIGAAFGAAFGAIFALLSLLFRRK